MQYTSRESSIDFIDKESSVDQVILRRKQKCDDDLDFQRKIQSTDQKLDTFNEGLSLTKLQSLSTNDLTSDSGKSEHSSTDIVNRQLNKIHASNQDKQEAQKMSQFKQRTISTIVLLAAFLLIVNMGHFYCSLIVIPMQIVMYREIMNMRKDVHQYQISKKALFLKWYMFCAVEYFLIPKFFLKQLLTQDLISQGSLLHVLLYDQHMLISFFLFIFGLIAFVLHLDHNSYKYQIETLSHQILALLFVVVIPSFTQRNIYQGFYWVVFPQLCVVTNDICSYLFGMMFGKTPLIQISPKKTWEGFIGGMLSTFAMAYILPNMLSDNRSVMCPVKQISIRPFQSVDCSQEYLDQYNQIVEIYIPFMAGNFVSISMLQIHSIVIAVYASLIAPFGGFFASGVKRAFGIKDFGNSIPGHGGLTDRFDCHGLMGVFTYMYLTQVVLKTQYRTDLIVEQFSLLSVQDQASVYHLLLRNAAQAQIL